MKLRKIIQEEIKKVMESDYYDNFPEFLDPQFNPQIGAYPPVGMHNYGSMVKEMESPDKEAEDSKQYKFYMLCDKLCQIEGVEVKNQMVADAISVSEEEFINNCAYSESMMVYHNIDKRSDPSMGFYKSNVKGVPCYFVQYAGFEFIFIEGGPSGNEHWLEDMWDEEGNFIYEAETIEEDYPTNFSMEEFKALPSFAARIRYAEERLPRISSGSARIVYKIDGEKALKLAKNKAGVAQNEVEYYQSGSYDISNIVARVFDADEENFLWIEMELAKKMNKPDFKRITGFDFNDYAKAMHNYGLDSGVMRHGYKHNVDKEVVERMWEDEFVYAMFDYIPSYDIPPGDLMKTSSYGIVDRDGEEEIVLIDYGFNKSVHAEYYS